MEAKEKPNDPNDPRECTAIPHGGWKLVGGIVFHAWLVVGVWLMSRWTGMYLERITTMSGAWLTSGGVFALALMFVNGVLFWRQIPWLRRYWLRGVRGYQLACWLSTASERPRKLYYEVLPPGKPVGEVVQPTLLLPLGGWFRRPTTAMPKDRSGNAPRRGQIRVLRLELLHQDGTERAIAGSVVRLSDRHGNRFTVTVWQALEIFEKFGAGLLNNRFLSLTNVLGDLHAELDRTREAHAREITEHNAASGYVQQLAREVTSQRRNAGLGFMEAIAAIESSSRLKDTIEGLFLLQRLHMRIIEACEEESPKEHWRARLAIVDAKIVEKQRRDRRRHGRGAAPAAT